LSAELKSTGSFIYAQMNALIGSSAQIIDPDYFTANSPNTTTLLGGVQNTTYAKRTFTGGLHSAVSGTGAQTVKAQFATSSGTGYIKNVYLTAVNIPL